MRALVRKGEDTSTFLYTSAISEAAATGFSKLGWAGDRRFPMAAGLVPLARSLTGHAAPGLEIEQRTVWAGNAGELSPIDEIWEHLRWPAATMMVRDADALRRHLALAGDRRYSLLIARRSDKAIGYLLSRTLPRRSLRAFGPVRVGIVSDFLVNWTDTVTLRGLLREACRRWWTERVGVLMAMSAAPAHRATFDRLGLLRPLTIGDRLFGARLTSRSMYRPAPGSEGNWHMTFADNDTDLILGTT